MKPPFSITYDKEADVLYLVGSDNAPALVREVSPGVLLRFGGGGDGDLVGITLVDASKLNGKICHPSAKTAPLVVPSVK